MNSTVQCNADQYKRENYMTDLNNGNFKKNLNTIIISISIEEDHINSSCVNNNIDNQWQNLIL